MLCFFKRCNKVRIPEHCSSTRQGVVSFFHLELDLIRDCSVSNQFCPEGGSSVPSPFRIRWLGGGDTPDNGSIDYPELVLTPGTLPVQL